MKQVVADTEYYGKSELLLDLKRPGCLGRPKQKVVWLVEAWSKQGYDLYSPRGPDCAMKCLAIQNGVHHGHTAW